MRLGPGQGRTKEYTPPAAAGSKGDNGARNTEEIAGADPKTWVHGQYTQPDRAVVRSGPVGSFTTESGIRGGLGTVWSAGVEKSKECATDGKAMTFAFKNAQGDLVPWSFYGAEDVSGEVPEATVRQIAATVQFAEDPSDS
ncbi:hypothetical protein ACFSL4_03575 [Streptomyces caeni]|uniref:DUF8017 domain-containing protein n=1 Tax=Streptomyces caeni TaxID=2307231 RepID=A0ABW4ILA4_9ACTN